MKLTRSFCGRSGKERSCCGLEQEHVMELGCCLAKPRFSALNLSSGKDKDERG